MVKPDCSIGAGRYVRTHVALFAAAGAKTFPPGQTTLPDQPILSEERRSGEGNNEHVYIRRDVAITDTNCHQDNEDNEEGYIAGDQKRGGKGSRKEDGTDEYANFYCTGVQVKGLRGEVCQARGRGRPGGLGEGKC